MSSVVISGDTSGAITLAAPAVSGTNTATLPAATGTVMVSGNMPAFSATKVSATQSITSNTWTKVTFDTEEFDTANCFASSTFTPTVAGYYQVNGVVDIYPSVAGSRSAIRIYKNGSNYKSGNDIQIATQVEIGVVVSAVCYCNGTTDYLELYALMTATSPAIQNYSTRFDAVLVRGA
jgi:hypothetical protein